ncbi:MAG: hypothetical protein BWY04_00408 [candidate division CPR1 bacterium ADurb.Bin160]|uniref:Uncharacterized protein n=1 Tax=candidate division CPR1 bacterium ADurb.Bin160 TaxID=1852826 RepID=A0A1V5ZPR9_9BACT|nr:MAG: hypothetical protein BWY04_00408 [candidate division CPR1 bacterium ADurb.Bin160]
MALFIIQNEFMFFNSTLVHKGSLSFFLIEIFTSTLICHFSISALEILLYLTILCSSFKNSTTSSSFEKSGQVTISIKGVPARLKSIKLCHHS